MEQVLTTYVDSLVAVLQDEDDTRLCHIVGGNHRMHAEWSVFDIEVLLHVCKQIQSELVQPEIHDIDARVHILNIHHFLLEALQLSLAIVEVSLLLVRNQDVAVACTRDVHTGHTSFYTSLQAQVIVEFDVWPVVDQLNHIVV